MKDFRDIVKAIGQYDVTVTNKSGIVIARRSIKNLYTTEGANYLWDIALGGGSASDPWYIGLINATPTPTLAQADTMLSNSWDELIPATDYTGNRKEWVESASAARTKTSSANAVFAILTTKTIYGLILTDAATGTGGILFSEAAFAVALPVVAGNTVNVVYSTTLS